MKEIEFKVPNGYIASNPRIEKGIVKCDITEFIPKCGDFVVAENVNGDRYPFIFKEKRNGHYYGYFGKIHGCTFSLLERTTKMYSNVDGGYATPSECTDIFNALASANLKWDRESNSIKRALWRADNGGEYFYIDFALTVARARENAYNIDDLLYSKCNYFKTKGEAEAFLNCIINKFKERQDL